MNNSIILRLRHPNGQNRLEINSNDTFGQLLMKIAKQCNYLVQDLILQTQDGRSLMFQNGQKIRQISYFQDGAIIRVSSRAPQMRKKDSKGIQASSIQNQKISSKCTHPPGGKCLNCIGPIETNKNNQKTNNQNKQQNSYKPKCNHGPGGRCLNCTVVNLKDKNQNMKWMCQHGPNAKCSHCLDKQFISQIAHISFDQYLADRKLKCKGVHPSDVKCGNCLAPAQIRYQVDRNCRLHQPYPKAMCNKCIPPSVGIKSQQYRHVDYVQFMNVAQFSKFVSNWVQKKHMAQQRVGFLYGYYAEDPHYKNGIRCIVQAIYQPKQKGTFNTFQILQTQQQLQRVDRLAQAGLGLQKVGWIYTQNNHDVIMSQNKVRMAARFQQMNQVMHSSGYPISNFITVILRSDQKNQHSGDVKPQVFMISDQGQALQKYSLFEQTDQRKVMKVRTPKSPQQALPAFLLAGKNITQFQPQFLLVKIGHGSSNSNKFAYIKTAEFPSKNQVKVTKRDLLQYLKKNGHKKSHIKYGDFDLLTYLAEVIDLGTAITIANCVQNQSQIDQYLDSFVKQIAQS